MLKAHVRAMLLVRALAEDTVFLRIQIVMFDVGVAVVELYVADPPVIRIDTQRHRDQTADDSVGARAA